MRIPIAPGCLSILIVLFTVSCISRRSFEISGELPPSESGYQVFLYSQESESLIDSVSTLTGTFSINHSVKYPQEFRVIIIVDSMKYSTGFFWVDSSKTRIVIDERSKMLAVRSCSNINKQLNELMETQKPLIDSASRVGWNKKHLEELQQLEISFINNHPDYILSAYLLEKLVRAKSSSQSDKKEWNDMFNRLDKDIRKSKWGKRFNASVNMIQDVSIGSIAPKFRLIDENGSYHSLKDFRNENILLCFWHSGCAGSSQFHDFYITQNPKYDQLDLLIINICLNNNKSDWLEYSKKTNLNELGQNLWIKKGRYGKTAIRYGILSTPDLYLLNAERKIISRGYNIIKELDIILNDRNECGNYPDFFGKPPSGDTSILLADSILNNTINIAFTPDLKQFFFTKDYDNNNTGDILIINKVDGYWTEPEPAPFNSLYTDNDISITPDGKYAYFRSWRPIGDLPENKTESLIWRSENRDGEWSKPYPVMYKGNFLSAGYPSTSNSGNLYFSKIIDTAKGFGDVFFLENNGGIFTRMVPVNNDPGNKFNEGDMCVSPDETFIITSCWGPDTLSGGESDLYISFKEKDGMWSELIRLGPEINSDIMENCPAISSDGNFLFFNRYDGMSGTAHWINTDVLNRYKSKSYNNNK